jgi:hypothetical protein
MRESSVGGQANRVSGEWNILGLSLGSAQWDVLELRADKRRERRGLHPAREPASLEERDASGKGQPLPLPQESSEPTG